MSMTGIAAGDVVRAVVNWNMPNGVVAQSRFTWYRSDSETDTILFATMLGYLDTKITALFNTYKSAIANEVSLDMYTQYSMHYVAGEWVVEAYGGESTLSIAGTNVDDMSPHGVACLISYPTAVAGTRGKIYVPGLVEGAWEGSAVLASTVTTMEAFADAYLATWEPTTGRTFVPVVLSYKSGTPVLLTGKKVSPYVAYQRRRGPGRGM